MKTDILIIGGGPAGMAAALAARESGAQDILLVERNEKLGGILNQCIHNGFGLQLFKEELTGPEYAGRYADRIRQEGISCLLNTAVVSLESGKSALLQNEMGIFRVEAGAIILATGCRERPRGAISIPGSRPAGVYSAGTVQKLINCRGYMPGKKVVILGSGDIGLIMARRLTLEGAKVEAVCEILPYSSGLKRNIVQCLDDFGIPLLLSNTVTRIDGKERVTGVEVSQVDETLRPIGGTETYFDCDTLLLSVGLIPENELAADVRTQMDGKTGGPVVNDRMETNIEGLYSCGNALHVHDLADYASLEAETAGRCAAEAVLSGRGRSEEISCLPGFGVGSVVPQRISKESLEKGVTLSLRVKKPFERAVLQIKRGETVLKTVREPRFTPGEMIRVPVRSSADGDLTCEVECHD